MLAKLLVIQIEYACLNHNLLSNESSLAFDLKLVLYGLVKKEEFSSLLSQIYSIHGIKAVLGGAVMEESKRTD